MARIRICKEEDCHNAATTEGYCRLHYLRHWKKIRDSQRQTAARRLNRYIERVCKENPENYLDVIREDLRDPSFGREVDDALNFDDEEGFVFSGAEGEEEIEEMIRRLKRSE